MNIPFDRRIFRWQPEGIPPHGIQHPKALHPFETGDHIDNRVDADVPHVEISRRIGKHRQRIELRLAAISGRGR